MSNWKAALGAVFTREGVPHTIGEQTFLFWPLRPVKLHKAQKLLVPLLQSVASYLEKTSGQGYTERQWGQASEEVGPDGKRMPPNVIGSESIQEAITLDKIEYRDKRRDKLTQDLIEVITKEDTWVMLADLVVDSMRDVFPKDSTPPNVAKDLASELDLGSMADFLTGVWRANKQVFAPFLERFQSLQAKQERLEKILGGLTGREATADTESAGVPEEPPSQKSQEKGKPRPLIDLGKLSNPGSSSSSDSDSPNRPS